MVRDEDGHWLRGGCGFLGHKTNTFAELCALVARLDFVARLGVRKVYCYSDSLTTNRLLGSRE